ncbi:TPA: 50S ribosomal protein L24 [bacterium]|jgi:large subunit ribosomal protein L24|nr:50S ribosomal protein L24 [bacterium]
MKIKKGDKVRIMVGDSSLKGKEGIVTKVLRKENKVIVEGLNVVIKHQKPNQAHPDGARIEKEAPIHVSNVMVLDPKTNEPTRVGYKFEDGKKIRVAKKSGARLD